MLLFKLIFFNTFWQCCGRFECCDLLSDVQCPTCASCFHIGFNMSCSYCAVAGSGSFTFNKTLAVPLTYSLFKCQFYQLQITNLNALMTGPMLLTFRRKIIDIAHKFGASTLCIMTFSIETLSERGLYVTLSIMTFSIETLSIRGLYVTLNISGIQHKRHSA